MPMRIVVAAIGLVLGGLLWPNAGIVGADPLAAPTLTGEVIASFFQPCPTVPGPEGFMVCATPPQPARVQAQCNPDGTSTLTLDTTGFWLAPGEEAWRAVVRRGLNPVEGLSGVRNLFLTLLSMLSMCDPADLGGMIDSSNLGKPALFVFDRYPGGLGFSEQGFARLDELARAALDHLEACECTGGCPSCVGIPLLRPAQQQDPDLQHARGIPGKEAARVLLRHWLGEEA